MFGKKMLQSATATVEETGDGINRSLAMIGAILFAILVVLVGMVAR